MVFDRDAIKRSFSKAASTYDEFSGFQKDVAFEVFQRLTEMLRKREHALVSAPIASNKPEAFTFLDIGSGTGALAGLVASIPGASIYASDIALTMLRKAREKLGNSISLTAADCCFLPFRDESFDTAGSSLALQWAQDLTLAFTEAARILKPGGIFIFSTLGPATLWELRDCYKGQREIEFKDRASVESALAASGLEAISIENRVIKRRYNSFIELLKALKYIGAAPTMECGKGLSPGRQMQEAGRLYSERFASPQGGIEASYELIIAAARKA
jgi:malonyl-CoA O-methyltransferase